MRTPSECAEDTVLPSAWAQRESVCPGARGAGPRPEGTLAAWLPPTRPLWSPRPTPTAQATRGRPGRGDANNSGLRFAGAAAARRDDRPGSPCSGCPREVWAPQSPAALPPPWPQWGQPSLAGTRQSRSRSGVPTPPREAVVPALPAPDGVREPPAPACGGCCDDRGSESPRGAGLGLEADECPERPLPTLPSPRAAPRALRVFPGKRPSVPARPHSLDAAHAGTG